MENKHNYKLHYAKISLNNKDIQLSIYSNLTELYGYVLSESNTECVYLISIFDEVYVTDHIVYAIKFIENNINIAFEFSRINCISIIEDIDIHIQEYSSFEEAYKVALNMQEIKEFCYES